MVRPAIINTIPDELDYYWFMVWLEGCDVRFAFDRRYVPKRIEDAKRNTFVNESKTLVKFCEEDYIWNPSISPC